MEDLKRLIEKIKKGEETKETLYNLIRDFLKIEERKYIAYVKGRALDFGELPALTWLGVEKAIETFDSKRDCSFLTWASRCIKYTVLAEVKTQKNREIPYDTVLGDDENGLSLSETIEDPSAFEKFSQLETSLDGKKALDAFKLLSPLEKKIVYLTCIKDMPLAKCARGIGITASRARCIRLSALRKMKEKLSTFHYY